MQTPFQPQRQRMDGGVDPFAGCSYGALGRRGESSLIGDEWGQRLGMEPVYLREPRNAAVNKEKNAR